MSGRADDTDFELYLNFIKSFEKMHEFELEINEFATLIKDTYEGRMDFIIRSEIPKSLFPLQSS